VSGTGQADSDAAALLGEIGREAEQEKEKILAEARERAGALLAAADARLAAVTSEAERRMEKQARVDADRLSGQAMMEAAGERLRARREVYGKAVASARQRIDAQARGPSGRAAVRALVSEALQKVPGEARILVSAHDRETCAQLLRETGRNCRIEAADVGPGTVVVEAADGRRSADNSLGARLERAAESMEAVIAGRLFRAE
jgi:V/A-type H+-transporting ATPase subunit E